MSYETLSDLFDFYIQCDDAEAMLDKVSELLTLTESPYLGEWEEWRIIEGV